MCAPEWLNVLVQQHYEILTFDVSLVSSLGLFEKSLFTKK